MERGMPEARAGGCAVLCAVLAAAALLALAPGLPIYADSEPIKSPIKQYNAGVPLEQIQCLSAKILMESPSGGPVCAHKEMSLVLADRGFRPVVWPAELLARYMEADATPGGGLPAISLGVEAAGDGAIHMIIRYDYTGVADPRKTGRNIIGMDGPDLTYGEFEGHQFRIIHSGAVELAGGHPTLTRHPAPGTAFHGDDNWGNTIQYVTLPYHGSVPHEETLRFTAASKVPHGGHFLIIDSVSGGTVHDYLWHVWAFGGQLEMRPPPGT